jgi:uncharacterized protein involved in outer membrane biogenesis
MNFVPVSAHPSLLRGLRNTAFALIALVALFALVGFFVVPPIAKSQIETRATEALGRQVTVGKVAFNPFTLKATLSDFVLADRDRPLFTFDALDIDLSSASVWHRAPVFDALRFVHPRVALTRNSDGTYSVQDLIDRMLAGPKGPTPLFSLNNIEIDNGSFLLDDRPHGRSVAVTNLAIGIPFLSSLPYDAEIRVTPRFEGEVDGARFGLAGEATTPFADTEEATLALNLDSLPLARYVEYLPLPQGLKLKDGALTTRLSLAFVTDHGTPRALTLSGTARIDGLALTRTDGSSLIAAKAAEIKIRKLDALGHSFALDSVTIDGPDVDLRRFTDGTLEIERLVGAAPASSDTRASDTSHANWTYAVGDAHVSNGTLHLSDDAVSPAFRATLLNIAVQGQRLASSGAAGAMEITFDSDEGAHFTGRSDLDIAGKAARGHFDLTKFHLAKLYPYYAEALNLDVRQGTLDFNGDFDVAAGAAKPQVVVTGSAATLADLDLAVRGERDPLWRVPRIDVGGVSFDLDKRSVKIEQVQSRQAAIRVVRERDGVVNFQRLVRTTPQTGAQTKNASNGASDAGWQLSVHKLAFDSLSAQFDDRVPEPPVKLTIANAKIVADDLSNARNAKGRIDVAARVGASGRVHVIGALATNPLAGDWRVDASAIDLVPLRPYFEARTNVVVTRGSFGAKGRLVYGGSGSGAVRAIYAGDVTISDFNSLDRPTSQDLVRWKSLAFTGVDATTDPFKLALGGVAMNGFYARLIINPDATLNLQQLLASRSAESEGVPPGPTVQAAGVATKELPPPKRDSELPVTIGRVELADGEVEFSDFFVRPNYSAHLTAVTGSVSALSAVQAGDVELGARVENTAPVELRGKVNPFARDLTLDLTATAKDVDLPPLTPYSAKYAGYGIQKGKLSLEVHYQIENRKLVASNRLVLDQLTFGERVESPTATKLPVLLAVSLLKDRDGVIHLDLPIEGTLDDPKFSVWGIIVQIIVNLVTKAATAPFALLGSLVSGGGGEQLAYVEFAPGHAEISAAAEAKLRSLAKALADRPGLKLDAAGRAVPEVDRDGLKHAALDRAIRSEKQKAAASQGESPPLDSLAIEASEYPKYLAAVYRNANLADKPRNVLGIAKDIPPAEMEALLLASYGADDEALRALATRRAQTVKDWFAGPGGIAGERIFIVSPKLGGDGIEDKGPPTRVDFALK